MSLESLKGECYLKKIIAGFLSVIFILSIPFIALADVSEGDVIATLGADLTPQQKEEVLNDMNVNENEIEIVEVTNEEEHAYLGSHMPKAQIGSKAISSAKITIGKKGSGIIAQSKNINYVSNEMYINALVTAGVKDAEVYVTAPFTVSGTGALTGILKAYEVSTGEKIPEKQKQVANEEMVTTAKLGEKEGVGQEKAANLMTTIKEKIAENPPQTDEEMKEIIENAADQTGIELTEEEKQTLIDLFNKIKGLNIDWDHVGDQLKKAKEKWDAFVQSEEGQGFLATIKDILNKIIEAIKSWLSS